MNIIDDRKQQINQNMDERRKYDDVFISKIRSNFKLYTFDVGLTLFFFLLARWNTTLETNAFIYHYRNRLLLDKKLLTVKRMQIHLNPTLELKNSDNSLEVVGFNEDCSSPIVITFNLFNFGSSQPTSSV